MAILVTGATGQVGSRLAQLLYRAGHTVVAASRTGTSPGPYEAVKFDWFDRRTFVSVFEVEEDIDRVFLVAPPVNDSFALVKTFIDFAIWKGVQKFVFCAPDTADQLGDTSGKIIDYLAHFDVDYVVVRPSLLREGASFRTQKQGHILSMGKGQPAATIHVENMAQASYDALVTDRKVEMMMGTGKPQPIRLPSLVA